MRGLTEDQIIEIAKKKLFYVSKYLWRFAGLRKKTRRMHKDGKLTLVEINSTDFVYRIKNEN